jgi:hypothetical protein
MEFTAQHGEGVWISEHWQSLNLPVKGTFVEVGAADGLKFSNTWWLEQIDWAGLCVEPDPRFRQRLQRTAHA